MKLDSILKPADNGQERINLTAQDVYAKVADNTDLDDCGQDKDDSNVNVNVTNNIDQSSDLKQQLLLLFLQLLSSL